MGFLCNATEGCRVAQTKWLTLQILLSTIEIMKDFFGGRNMRNFADKLYRLRTQSGYSQEALAEKVNVSRQAISKWELGLTLPDTDKIVALSKVFDVTIDYLLKDEIKVNKDESLDRLVLKFLGSAQDMEEISKELVDIMQDGMVDDMERRRVNEIVRMLDDISAIIDEIRTKMSMQ